MPKLPLTNDERSLLRKHKVKVAEVNELATSELAEMLYTSQLRAQKLRAHATFQAIPSIGPKFAEDLILIGKYDLESLTGTTGAELLNTFERHNGVWTDPCVEDQFRLAVHVAKTGDYSKQWPDFTAERKAFRAKHGYPKDRPTKPWHEQ
ncbi:MAG: helix-hairpin-helix domain-containing protein [Saprospiraceae bacterium]